MEVVPVVQNVTLARGELVRVRGFHLTEQRPNNEWESFDTPVAWCHGDWTGQSMYVGVYHLYNVKLMPNDAMTTTIEFGDILFFDPIVPADLNWLDNDAVTGVDIYWGDELISYPKASWELEDWTHTYTVEGDYEIQISVTIDTDNYLTQFGIGPVVLAGNPDILAPTVRIPFRAVA